MPLVVLGDGMLNKNHVKFKGKMIGVVGVIHEQLKLRESRGELLLLTMDVFLISHVRPRGLHINISFS